MNQIQCDVAGCQERSPVDAGYNWTEVKHSQIDPHGAVSEYQIRHVCPKCLDKFHALFFASRPAGKNNTLGISGVVRLPDGSFDVIKP